MVIVNPGWSAQLGPTNEGELTQRQLQKVMGLVAQIFEQSRGFKVYPPKEVTDDPKILSSQLISEKLVATKWWLHVHGGEEAVLTFRELLSLVHQLREVKRQLDESPKAGQVKASFEFTMKQLLEPDMAIRLLASLNLEGIERQQVRITYPLFGLHDGEEGEDAKLVGTRHPQTGHNIVFVFTDKARAVAFAAAFQRGRVVRVADDLEKFKQVLKRCQHTLVAFDPICRSGQVEVKAMALVKEILGE